MIALIKIGNSVYENVPTVVSVPKKFDEKGMPVTFEEKPNPLIPNDAEELKHALKDTISWFTDRYIQSQLNNIDEDLPDLISEKSYLEGVFASQGISPEQVRNETVLVVLGKKTVEQAITDLSIPNDLVSDFKRAVEIARIIAWKEAIWKAEERLESQIDSMSLEQLLQLDVKKMCETAYAEIPLEV